MKTIKVEYQVKADKLDVTLPAIRQFIKEAQADSGNVAHYSGYQYVDEPTKFVHLMKFASPENEQAHSAADYTKRFVEVLYPNCDIQPHFDEITEQ